MSLQPPSLRDRTSADEPAAVTSRSWTYRPQLDGIRALAVTLVLLFHIGVASLPGGFVGVDVFFVLSGYLITGLLVDESSRSGTVRLARFYARRARRLLPAAWAVIIFVMVVGLLDLNPVDYPGRQHQSMAALLYVANWDWVVTDTDYFAPGDLASPLIHFWSLAVEEQFYLVWPAVVVAVWWLSRRARREPLRVMFALVGAITVLSATAAVLTTPSPAAYYGTHTRAFELTAGGLLAVGFRLAGLRAGVPDGAGDADNRPPGRRLLGGRRVSVGAGTGLGVAASLAVILWESHRVVGARDYPGLDGLVITAASVALIAASDWPADRATRSARLLGNRVFAWIGRLSYSIYVWHWPLIVFFLDDLKAAIVPVVLAVAWLSFTFLEQPIRHRLLPSLAPVRVVVASLAVSATLALIAAPLLFRIDATAKIAYAAIRDNAPPGDCPYFAEDWPDADQAEPCVLRTGAGATVAFVGDSHAQQWQPALLELAAERDWTLVRATRGGCPANDVVPLRPGDDGIASADNQCVDWRHAVYPRLVAEYDPDLVFVATRSHVLTLVTPDGHVLPNTPEQLAAWSAGWGWTLDTFGVGAATTVVSQIMPTMAQHVPRCLAVAPRGLATDDCNFSSVDPVAAPYNEIIDHLPDGRPNVAVVAPVHFVCPADMCLAVENGVIEHRDDNHLSATYVAAHAADVGGMLDDVTWRNVS